MKATLIGFLTIFMKNYETWILGSKRGISKKGPFLPNKGMRGKMDFPAYGHALIDGK